MKREFSTCAVIHLGKDRHVRSVYTHVSVCVCLLACAHVSVLDVGMDKVTGYGDLGWHCVSVILQAEGPWVPANSADTTGPVCTDVCSKP